MFKVVVHYFRCTGILQHFCAIFTKGNNCCDFLSASLEQHNPSKKKSALKGKNLLQEEQILSFKS